MNITTALAINRNPAMPAPFVRANPPTTNHAPQVPLPEVRRTLAISCEAVPAVSRPRGHEAAPLVWCPRNQPGAAESLVSFIALFGDPLAFLSALELLQMMPHVTQVVLHQPLESDRLAPAYGALGLKFLGRNALHDCCEMSV